MAVAGLKILELHPHLRLVADVDLQRIHRARAHALGKAAVQLEVAVMTRAEKIVFALPVIDEAAQVRADRVQRLGHTIDEAQVHRTDAHVGESVPRVHLVCHDGELGRRAVGGNRVERGDPDEAVAVAALALGQGIEIRPNAGTERHHADERADEHAQKLDKPAPLLRWTDGFADIGFRRFNFIFHA